MFRCLMQNQTNQKGMPLKIATWNVNSLKVRLEQLINWLDKNQPDIIAIQETKTEDHNFPLEQINSINYHAIFAGQKAYNGVAILSKIPATNIEVSFLNDPKEQKRVISANYNDIRVINIYIPNGESISSEKYIYKLDWLDKFIIHVKQQLKQNEKLIILGDFNIAPEDEDVYDPTVWQGQVLFSEPERAELKKLISLGLNDTFRLFPQEPASFTWWDYRAAAFRRNMGLRIDHILASHKMSQICKSCVVDKAQRKVERPSDHAPVMAEFDE